MPSREQTYAMLILNKHTNNFFSTFPPELIRDISTFDEGPNSDIGKALKYAAYARKEDVEALLEMLGNNPSLLLETGNVITPGGDEIRRVTIYEFALGAGDYELAEKVQSYFSTIGTKDAEQQRICQYERYKPHIEGMLKQEPYDLKPLIKLIKEASAEDVTALLNKDMTHKSELRDAMMQFRTDWAPRILTKPGMHYNYASLQHAFNLLDREWDDLHKTSGDNRDKIDLVWRQLIGFEMRRLPGIDRCVMAQGLYPVIEKQVDCARSYKFQNRDGDFPIMAGDDSLGGLGGDFSVGLFGQRSTKAVAGGVAVAGRGPACWKTYVEQKLQSNKNLKRAELMRSQPEYQPTGCLIL